MRYMIATAVLVASLGLVGCGNNSGGNSGSGTSGSTTTSAAQSVTERAKSLLAQAKSQLSANKLDDAQVTVEKLNDIKDQLSSELQEQIEKISDAIAKAKQATGNAADQAKKGLSDLMSGSK